MKIRKKFQEIRKENGILGIVVFVSRKILQKSVLRMIRYYIIWQRRDIELLKNPEQIVHISPNQITSEVISDRSNYYGGGGRILRHNKDGQRIAGTVYSGPWHIYTDQLINQSPVYKAFYQRFVEGMQWENTDYYIRFTKNRKLRGCDNWEQFKQKNLQRWDKLYEEIKTNGYADHTKRGKPPTDEIEVAVGRDGEILFVDGKHRLAIAKLLKLPEVPVIVNIWHKDFIEYVIKQTGEKYITPEIAIRYTKPLSK